MVWCGVMCCGVYFPCVMNFLELILRKWKWNSWLPQSTVVLRVQINGVSSASPRDENGQYTHFSSCTDTFSPQSYQSLTNELQKHHRPEAAPNSPPKQWAVKLWRLTGLSYPGNKTACLPVSCTFLQTPLPLALTVKDQCVKPGRNRARTVECWWACENDKGAWRPCWQGSPWHSIC